MPWLTILWKSRKIVGVIALVLSLFTGFGVIKTKINNHYTTECNESKVVALFDYEQKLRAEDKIRVDALLNQIRDLQDEKEARRIADANAVLILDNTNIPDGDLSERTKVFWDALNNRILVINEDVQGTE